MYLGKVGTGCGKHQKLPSVCRGVLKVFASVKGVRQASFNKLKSVVKKDLITNFEQIWTLLGF